MILEHYILTLDWIKQHAGEIAGAWNGQDDTFELDGEVYPAEKADIAREALILVQRLEELLKAL